MVNNQLKNLYKKNEKSLSRRKTHLKKKKTSLNRVLPGRLVTGHLGFFGFLLIPIFCLTCTCPAIGSTRSLSICRAGPSLITILVGKIFNIFISYD